MEYRVELDGNIRKKMEAKHKFWKKISSHCLVLGTGNALFSCFDHLSYFDHKLLIFDPI